MQSARRPMAVHVVLVAVATLVYMTVSATRTPVWAVIALARRPRRARRHVTLAAHPLVARERVGFPAQITALNSDEDIDRLNATLTAPTERFRLRPRD
ncbi:hypothetical protein ABZ379_15480 [Streptomyces canus]|uniref:hypothetical protein n=1 Tax=Streptomyces canus TaxID=58343 RepID=UPI0033F1ECE6